MALENAVKNKLTVDLADDMDLNFLNKLEENFGESLKFDKEAEIKDEKELLNEAKQVIFFKMNKN